MIFFHKIIKFSEIHKKLPVIKNFWGGVNYNLILKKWQLPKKFKKNFFSKIFEKRGIWD